MKKKKSKKEQAKISANVASIDRLTKIFITKPHEGMARGLVLDVVNCEVMYSGCLKKKKLKHWLEHALKHGYAKPYVKAEDFASH